MDYKELLALAVTTADPFTALRYSRRREETPKLLELEEAGSEVLPGIEGSLLDLYYTLWASEPEVKEEEEVPASRCYWAQLLTSAMATSQYEQLHAQTALQELFSLLGTIAMGESVLKMIPEEDQERLRKLQQAEAEANAAAQQMQDAQRQADAASQLAVAAAKVAKAQKGQPGEAQAQAAALQFQQQTQAARAQAEAAGMTLEEAKARAEQIAQELMGQPGTKQAQQKATQLARIAQQATADAQAEVKETSSLLQSWGIEPGELTRQSIPGALDILKRMKSNPAFAKFASLVGRMRKLAARKARSTAKGEGATVVTVEYGRDLHRTHRSELVALVHPALRIKGLQRWMRGNLRLRGTETKERLGHGPIIVCEDGSGSMRGEKQMWAKALTLALVYYAKLRRRSFAWIHFGADYSPTTVRVYPAGQASAEQLLEIAETFLNASGTSFERPLREAVEVIRHEGLKKADIVLVTDGISTVTDAFLKELLAVKKTLEVQIFTVLVNVGQTSNRTVEEFSDRIERISNFTAEEAGKKVIARVW